MADPNSGLFSLSCLLVTTLALLHYPTSSVAQTLFVFGDGYYDAGNKQFLSGNRVDANSPPYGISVGEATGRWSDGRIVPDYLAGFMGIPRIPPILRSSGDFTHGASFAIAGATVLGSALETMTLSQQVKKFSQNKNKWTDKALSEAIYLTYIGSDDYLNYAKNNPNPSHDQKQAFVDQVITSIEAAIKAVHEAGGRKFAFQNLPPLGCLPMVKQETGNNKDCVKLPSEMAALHNNNLSKLIEKLALDLESFQFSFYDFFSSIQNRVLEPHTYIFGTGTAACCGTGPLKGTGCAANNVCVNPNGYVFFDGKYLTQKANFQVADLMWNANPQVIEPNNLRELLVFPLDIPFIYNVKSLDQVGKDGSFVIK
ncbi:PREDICTED: inactive GDSL esterase/lipase-like protein 25 isoform X2 [Camelina sativa]|uniref:Inactive GDSL esterase/lipase-like protein 25 isoform X2 n=1 Tax=Camelina sativa TaxID=90675 RepID=A0ABM0YJ68_CAMSA|nr:PREDICTED: inactive GDSL esterase/lipase-like protein 25 isoform X2 [Camelina sativa]